MRDQTPQSRRSFLSLLAAAGAGTLVSGWGMPRVFAQGSAPPLITPEATRPTIPYGVASGDVTDHSAIIWSRTDRPGRMFVEYATTESFKNPRRVQGPAALALDDFTARVDLTGLPPGQEIFYRVTFQDLSAPKVLSTPAVGHFRTAPAERRDLTLAWGGDTAGQGWGINPEWGGMKIYEQMRRVEPAFFIHSGDTIYADGPIPPEKEIPGGGGVWKNLTTEAKSKVAETLDEFRANFAYNLLDENKRRFAAEVPFLVQARDFQKNYDDKALDRFWADIITSGLSHPFPVWRTSEILKWVESEQYQRLMNGAPEIAAA